MSILSRFLSSDNAKKSGVGKRQARKPKARGREPLVRRRDKDPSKKKNNFKGSVEEGLYHAAEALEVTKEFREGFIFYGYGVQEVTPEGAYIPSGKRTVERVYQDINERFYHGFTSGATGHGKTVLQELEVANFLANGFSQVIFDFKPDLDLMDRAKWAADLVDRGDQFRLISPNFPNFSYYINPIAKCETPDEMVARIIQSIQEEGDEQFFIDTAESVLNAVIRCCMTTTVADIKMSSGDIIPMRGKDLTIRTLWQILADREALEMLYEHASDLDGKVLLKKFLTKPVDYFEKITSTLDVRLARMAVGDFARMFNPPAGYEKKGPLKDRVLDIETSLSRGDIIYFMLPVDLFGPIVYGLAKMIFQSIQSFSNKRNIRKETSQKIAILADESDKVLYPSIDSFFTRGRSASVAMNLIMQSKWQIVRKLDEAGAGVILANALTKIWGRCDDFATADYFSELAGEADIYSHQASIRHGAYSGLSSDDQTSLGVTQNRRRMVEPENLMYLDIGEMYIRSPALGVWRIRVSRLPDIKHPFSDVLMRG